MNEFPRSLLRSFIGWSDLWSRNQIYEIHTETKIILNSPGTGWLSQKRESEIGRHLGIWTKEFWGQFLKQIANGLTSARKQLRVFFLRRLWTLRKFSLTSTVVVNGRKKHHSQSRFKKLAPVVGNHRDTNLRWKGVHFLWHYRKKKQFSFLLCQGSNVLLFLVGNHKKKKHKPHF